jgi:hypothetical protein
LDGVEHSFGGRLVHRFVCGITIAFTCRAAWNGAVSRKTKMAARSGATLC